MNKQEILKKAEEELRHVEKNAYFLNICRKADICPRCGAKILKHKRFLGSDHKCSNCDYFWNDFLNKK